MSSFYYYLAGRHRSGDSPTPPVECMTASFIGGDNSLFSGGISFVPDWFTPDDFEIDWGNGTIGIFIWNGSGWDLTAGDYPPSETGEGVLTQDVNTVCLVWSGGTTFDSSSVSLFEATSTPLDLTDKKPIDSFIKGLKEDSLWSKIGLLTVLSSAGLDISLRDWKDPSRSITNVGASFTPYQGFKGDGTSGHLLWPYAPTSVGAARDSISMGCYVEDGTSQGAVIALTSGTPRIQLNPRSSSNQFSGRLSATTSVAVSNSDRNGFFVLSRGNSANIDFYKDGSLISNVVSASTQDPNQTTGCLLRASAAYENDLLKLFFVGSALSSTDVSNLAVRFNTYRSEVE